MPLEDVGLFKGKRTTVFPIQENLYVFSSRLSLNIVLPRSSQKNMAYIHIQDTCDLIFVTIPNRKGTVHMVLTNASPPFLI